MARPIIHLMHFPWDREQRLLADPEAFDHRPVEAMRAYAPDFEVRMWTYPEARALCETRYPEVWQALQFVARPVMLVDVLRWVVVHEFGGIYWQMNTTPLAPMSAFFPAPNKLVRLFTEFELSPEQCRAAAAEPIREGRAEESTRILIQVFSAAPGAAFVKQVIDFLVERVRRYQPRRDYDILYITGNAAISEAYDRFGRTDPSVELTDRTTARGLMKWHYRGSWRTDRAAVEAQSPSQAPAAQHPLVQRAAALVYRWLRVHPHVQMFRAWSNRSSALNLVLPLCRRLGVTRVCEIACGRVSADDVPPSFAYEGLDLDRALIRENRRAAGGRAKFSDRNMLYRAAPPAELYLCMDYLERVPFHEARRILNNILRGGGRYLALSDHPLLVENWDAALGDPRPINWRATPFCFPEPIDRIVAADVAGRTDRSLAVWDTDKVKASLS